MNFIPDSNINTHTAIDTETVEGKPILICSPKSVLWFPQTFEQIASFLINVKRNEGHHVWTFNLDFDVTGILKFLPRETLVEIREDNKTQYNNYTLTFIPKKFFSISYKNKKITLVDAMQFLNSSLDDAASQYLHQNKESNLVTETFKSKQRLWPAETLINWAISHKNLMEKYCKKDAFLTAELGRIIDQSANNIFAWQGRGIEAYTSNAKLGEKKTLDFCNGQYPKAFFNSQVVKFAILSMRGGIFETWKRGMFDEVTDIDQNSAYPHKMISLPHWGNGSFEELSDEIIDEIEEKNKHIKYGWVVCNFDCPFIPWNTEEKENWELSINDETFEVETEIKKIIYPTGERTQCITLEEYYFMREYNYSCELIGGYVWKEKEKKYPNPFSWIHGISEKKKELKREGKKGTMDYQQCKIGMNGAYGKTVQKTGDLNLRKLYNPMYGSYITAETRVAMVKFILDNKYENKVINIATDGILLEGNMNIYSSEELGSWEVKHYDSAFIIGNGMLQLEKDGKVSSRLRGLTNKQNTDIKSILQHRRNSDKYLYLKNNKRIGLGEALIHIKKHPDIKDLNTFVKMGRELKVNSDIKRNWPLLQNFGDLLDNKIEGKRWSIEEYKNRKNKEKNVEDKI